MMSDDPFLEVKEDVERALRRANALYSQLNQILSSPSANIPAADADIKRLCEEIRSLIRPLDEDLNDLDETIKVVQVNPGSFNLDKKDVEERKAFISATRRSMQDMRSTINNPHIARQGGEKGMRDALFATKSKPGAGSPETPAHLQNNQRLIESEQKQQMQLMQNQDKEIEAVASTVVNLKEIAVVMGNELDEQSRLIDHMELKVDNTSNNLQAGLKRMKDFINANADSKQQICIVGLIILLVILLVLLFTV